MADKQLQEERDSIALGLRMHAQTALMWGRVHLRAACWRQLQAQRVHVG